LWVPRSCAASPCDIVRTTVMRSATAAMRGKCWLKRSPVTFVSIEE